LGGGGRNYPLSKSKEKKPKKPHSGALIYIRRPHSYGKKRGHFEKKGTGTKWEEKADIFSPDQREQGVAKKTTRQRVKK